MATTNIMIIEMYKAEHNIRQPLHTYAKWQSLGYQVKRGEKSQHKITIWKSCTKKVKTEEAEVTTSKMIMKTSAFFTLEQVEPIKKSV